VHHGPRRAIRLGAALIFSAALVATIVLFVPGGTPPGDETLTPVEGEQIISLTLPQETPTATLTPGQPVEPTSTTAPPTFTPTPDPRFAGTTVCLDPGHGGSDRGYVREANEAAPAMEEAVVNLEHARALRGRLEALGFSVVLTRDDDVDVNADFEDVNLDGLTRNDGIDSLHARELGNLDELQARIDICNRANADLLVSLHINGYPDPTASGYETWYSSARPFAAFSKLFASLAHDELGTQMRAAGYDAYGREVKDDSEWKLDDGHQHVRENYVMLGPMQDGVREPSAMPGAIVEALFISHDGDANFLSRPEGAEAIVTAYEQAIIRYFQQTRR
jgi:N-acetylmuramoyl-L-alanine amidase